ncbi:hypothetical protein [Bdellovibrio sp. HCB2-146]|uniref:hypothetical protein n=1 Tax=Bdellovibrio sp. HCB2-146 TaxID=3394362 RepID=UPI0039BC9B0B
MKFFLAVLLIAGAVIFQNTKAHAEEVAKSSEQPSLTEAPEPPQERWWNLAPIVSTDIPVFIGGGFSVKGEPMEFQFQYGLTPEPYADLIGTAAAEIAGNEAYKGVVKAAFENNNMLRADLLYRFTGNTGWKIAMAYLGLQSQGKAEIDDILFAATGRDYTNLKNLLIAAGRESTVDMNSTLGIIEAYISYGYMWGRNWNFDISFGVAKVVAADVKLKTGLPNFEASQAGSTLMRNTEGDLEDIIYEYGTSPKLGLTLQYLF